MALLGEAMACGVVKTEPPEEMAIPVGQILYSQWTCAGTFGGGPYAGRPLHEATADLIRGALDPLQHDWLVLDVVKGGSHILPRTKPVNSFRISLSLSLSLSLEGAWSCWCNFHCLPG